jgi:hypothetical protein
MLTKHDLNSVKLTDDTKGVKVINNISKKKRAYKIDPRWKVCGAARRRFNRLPTSLQNTDNKKIIIKETLAENSAICPDSGDFWAWYHDQTGYLKRTWDFEKTCDELGLDAQAVAEHLVLEGKQFCKDVRLEGLNRLGNVIRQYGEPLFDDEFNLYNKKVENE